MMVIKMEIKKVKDELDYIVKYIKNQEYIYKTLRRSVFRGLKKRGHSCVEIGKVFGMTRVSVSEIMAGRQ